MKTIKFKTLLLNGNDKKLFVKFEGNEKLVECTAIGCAESHDGGKHIVVVKKPDGAIEQTPIEKCFLTKEAFESGNHLVAQNDIRRDLHGISNEEFEEKGKYSYYVWNNGCAEKRINAYAWAYFDYQSYTASIMDGFMQPCPIGYESEPDAFNNNEYDIQNADGTTTHVVGRNLKLKFNAEEQALLDSLGILFDKANEMGIRFCEWDEDGKLYAYKKDKVGFSDGQPYQGMSDNDMIMPSEIATVNTKVSFGWMYDSDIAWYVEPYKNNK